MFNFVKIQIETITANGRLSDSTIKTTNNSNRATIAKGITISNIIIAMVVEDGTMIKNIKVEINPIIKGMTSFTIFLSTKVL